MVAAGPPVERGDYSSVGVAAGRTGNGKLIIVLFHLAEGLVNLSF